MRTRRDDLDEEIAALARKPRLLDPADLEAKRSPSRLGPPPGKAARPGEDLMNGLQRPGKAKTQDEIDALLGFD